MYRPFCSHGFPPSSYPVICQSLHGMYNVNHVVSIGELTTVIFSRGYLTAKNFHSNCRSEIRLLTIFWLLVIHFSMWKTYPGIHVNFGCNNCLHKTSIKRMAPTAPQSKALVIQPEGRRPRGRPRNRWEVNVPRWYKEMGIQMTDVNNWANERRPIVYPLDADGRRVRLK